MKYIVIISALFFIGCESPRESGLDVCIKACAAMGKKIEKVETKGFNVNCTCGEKLPCAGKE